MREYTFPYLHFSISQRYRLNHQEISLIQRNRNFITYCVTYKKCAFRFETLPSFFFDIKISCFETNLKLIIIFLHVEIIYPFAAEILARGGVLFVTDGSFIAPSILHAISRHTIILSHDAFQRYFPILISFAP